MCDETTYSESYLKNENGPSKLKPIIPTSIPILPYGAKFMSKTMYTESFVPCQADIVSPIVPIGTISLPDEKMANDTINKVY